VLEHVARRRAAEARDVDRGTVLERLERAHGVYARDEPPEPAQRVGVFQLGGAAGTARIEGERESLVLGERFAGKREGRHDRDLARHELERESVLFEQRFVRPASGAVELRDERGPVFQPELVDAVLVTVEAEEPPVAAVAAGFHRVQHDFGSQIFVGGHAQNLAHPAG
jgi:hypothetical protein